MVLISEIQYFAPVIFYLRLSEYSHCIFDPYETYRKMSFRNRCTLLGANGPVSLSVPLQGGRNQRRLMKDVLIDHKTNWRAIHWKTITSCYNRSPYLDYFRDELSSIYESKDSYLLDWNIRCFEWVRAKMAIRTPYSFLLQGTEEQADPATDDWRNRIVPATINKVFPDASPYPQVFGDRFGFVPNLSVLDYLFCVAKV